MNRRFFELTGLVLLAGLLFGLLQAPIAHAAALPQTVRQAQPASGVLTPEALGNLEYQSQVAPEGKVQLTNGQFEDADNHIVVLLVPQAVAYGTLNGQDAAAVLIAENGGGSGVFVNLEVVVDQDGTPVNVASTLLGDRVDVINLAIDNNQVVVEMVTQGPNDPMCCPTQLVRNTYALDGDQLALVDQTTLGSIPQITLENAPGGYSQALIPATPYDNSQPPGPVGAPIHAVLAFGEDSATTVMAEGKPFIAVYPAAEYSKLWSDAGNPTIADNIAALQTLLAERPGNPQPPLPILPPPSATNDLAAQVQYIDGNGFSGVRFIGRTAQDASPVVSSQLRYFFQGLTGDGAYVISAQAPISTTALPATNDEISADTAAAATADFTTYLADTLNTLNGLSDEEWTPMPSSLDQTIASLTITANTTSTMTPATPSVLTPDTLANMQYKSMLASSGTALLANGQYTETLADAPEGAPPISVSLAPEPMAFGTIDGNEAAAVLIVENGGGSGTFVSLAVVEVIDGTPANVATTMLGDRVAISHLAITDDGTIVVDMVTQGPGDAMCCPRMPTTLAYVVSGDQLVLVAQVAATIDAAGVSDAVSAAIIQPTAYDNSMPPGAQGQPKHPVWSLDASDPTTVMETGGAYVAIYNVAAYRDLWEAAGDTAFSDTLDQLQTLLTDKPENPPPPLPILPQQPATNDVAAQVTYLDLAGGGTGVRWVGRLSQDASPLMAYQLRYFFQGLTGDGQRLLVAMIPVTTTILPATTDEIPQETMDQATNDYPAYNAAITEQLNGLTDADFTPDLAALDTALKSVTVQEYMNTLMPGVLANLSYPSELAGTTVQLTNGKYEDTANQIVVSFAPSPIAYGTIDGQDSAAVLIAENGGGSGVFTNLAVVMDQEGTPASVASTLLGDRVDVTALSIQDNQITVNMITQGPNDPMCCPTLPVTQTYAITDGALSLVDETRGGTEASTGELSGTKWMWTGTLMSDGTQTTPAATDAFALSFNADSTANATTDCNAFSGTYNVSDGNQLTIDLPISTRMACPEGSQQDAYIKDLSSIQSYMLQDGNLYLMLPFDSGTMSFAPAAQ